MMGFDVRRLDIYRKVPKDLTQPTLTGAIISIVCCFTISVLLVSELLRFLHTDVISAVDTPPTIEDSSRGSRLAGVWAGSPVSRFLAESVSEVYVDSPGDSNSRIPVSITIQLPNLPCDYVGLDIQDDMGRHEVGFVENTEKTELNSGGGCLFHATFQVNKVPGNFHVSTHSAKKQPSDPDFTHTISSVQFGEKIPNPPKDLPGSFDPLQGVSKGNEMGIESHDYIMKVVPTVYVAYDGKETISYQYTFAYRSFLGRGHPAIWFRYDVSPLTVRYREKGEAVFSFMTAVCAVVGGVFTVANMIDGMVFSASEYYKKLEIGKVS